MRSRQGGLRWAERGLLGLAALLVFGATADSGALGAEADAIPGNYVRFQIWTVDSVAVHGLYYPAPAGAAPAALLLHQPGSEGSAYHQLALQLRAEGLPVFAPDLRGEGRSTHSRTGNVVPASHWSARERPLLRRDLDAVRAFALAQPGMGGREWVLVAEGEAVPLALEYAQHEARVRDLVLLSPLIPDEEPFPKCPPDRRYLVLACESDSLAAVSLRRLYGSISAPSRQMDLLPCRSRGVRMLRWLRQLDRRIIAWIEG